MYFWKKWYFEKAVVVRYSIELGQFFLSLTIRNGPRFLQTDLRFTLSFPANICWKISFAGRQCLKRGFEKEQLSVVLDFVTCKFMPEYTFCSPTKISRLPSFPLSPARGIETNFFANQFHCENEMKCIARFPPELYPINNSKAFIIAQYH